MEHVSKLAEITLKDRVFIALVFADDDQPRREFGRQMEHFSEVVGVAGNIVFPYSDETCLAELRGKGLWPKEAQDSLNLIHRPFMVVFAKDFKNFDPALDRWAICRRGFLRSDPYKREGQFDAITKGIASNKSIFDTLRDMQRRKIIKPNTVLMAPVCNT